MTPQELKSSILQLAMQGKLVPQDPNDEPASVLIERIRTEKEQLIKEGKIKREKNPSRIFRGTDNLPYEKVGNKEPVCIADAVPFEIPDSWEWVTLKQIAVTELGKTLDKAKNTGSLHPYLCSINIYWTGVDLSTVKQAKFEEAEFDKYRLQRGDLLVCEGGDVGRAAIWYCDDIEMFYQNALHRIRFYGNIVPEFFKLLLECYKGNKILDEYSKGVTIKHLVQGALNAIYFPLPPLAEQKRIVAKIEELLPYIDKYAEAWEKLEDFNKRFPVDMKKSILQMAVQGKLVPQDPNDEPASVLLEHIRAEKEQLIKAGKIKRDKHESVIYRRDNSYYEMVDGIERCIDDEIPFEIPDSWEWVRHNDYFEISGGSQPPKAKFISEPRPGYVRLYQIRDYGKSPIPVYIPASTATKVSKKGDILLARYGASLGKVFWAEEGAYNVAMAKVIPLYNSPLFIKEFLYFFYQTDLYRKIIFGNSRSAQAGFNKEDLSKMWMPVPPIAEQKRIVAKIEELLPLCDQLNN